MKESHQVVFPVEKYSVKYMKSNIQHEGIQLLLNIEQLPTTSRPTLLTAVRLEIELVLLKELPWRR